MWYSAEQDKCWWKVLDVNRLVTVKVLLQHRQSPPPHSPQTFSCRSLFKGICAYSGSLPSTETGKKLSCYFWSKSWGFTISLLSITCISESNLITIMSQYLINVFLLEPFCSPNKHYFHAFISLGWALTLQLPWVNTCRTLNCWFGCEYCLLIFQKLAVILCPADW